MELPNGIPSHDTFGRVFALLDPGVLEEKLMEWVRSVFVKKPERVIAVDGKSIRGTLDKCGDYILAVKANQKLLMEGIEETCALPRPVSRHSCA